MGIRPTLKAVRVPFGEKGLKIRAAAAGLAALFMAFAFGGASLLELVLPGAKAMGWSIALIGGVILFFRVYRSNDDGEVDIMHLHALVPLWLLAPGMIAVLIQEDFPYWGTWDVLGTQFTGGALYGLLLLFVFVYNLLRLNLQKSLRSRR
jgi:hypothetical protein